MHRVWQVSLYNVPTSYIISISVSSGELVQLSLIVYKESCSVHEGIQTIDYKDPDAR